MKVYKNALDVRLDCFGSENLQVAVAHEDLAYATYVNEYSTGECVDYTTPPPPYPHHPEKYSISTLSILFLQENSVLLENTPKPPWQSYPAISPVITFYSHPPRGFWLLFWRRLLLTTRYTDLLSEHRGIYIFLNNPFEEYIPLLSLVQGVKEC